jgi:hypothetical protein
MFGLKEMVAVLSMQLGPYPTAEDWLEVMACTLQGNVQMAESPRRPASATCIKDHLNWVVFLKELMEEGAVETGTLSEHDVERARLSNYSVLRPWLPALRPIEDIIEDDEPDPELMREFRRYGMTRGCDRSKSVFSTPEGYAGFGPPLMQKEDFVCLIHGAATPFLLWPCGDGQTYRLVGACYIHELMNGEGLGMCEEMDIILI